MLLIRLGCHHVYLIHSYTNQRQKKQKINVMFVCLCICVYYTLKHFISCFGVIYVSTTSLHTCIYIICYTQGSLSISLTLHALHTFVSYACMYLLLKHLLLTRLVVCLLLRVFVIFLLYFFSTAVVVFMFYLHIFFAIVKFT